MSPAEQAQLFADALLGNHGEALAGLGLSLSSWVGGESGPRTRLVAAQPSALASAVSAAAEDSAVTGVYVGVGLTKGPRAINPATGQRYKRLAATDVDGLAWLWIDIDLAGPGHADTTMALAPSREIAIAVAHSTGLAPTVLVDTGHGVQAHWRLSEPWIFGAVDADDDGRPVIDPERIAAERVEGQRLAWEWVKSLQIKGKLDHGIHVDPTTDIARLVRCPGSYNRKVAGDHRLVRVLDVDASRIYDLDQVRGVLAPEKLLAAHRYDTVAMTGSLAGVDLAGLFAAARAYPRHEPDWLAEVVASGWAPELAAIWLGAADARYGNDHSAIDMALAASILHAGLSPELAVEAVMCRRLRVGVKVEKVDPAQRTSYLEMTIGKIVATQRAHEGKVAAQREAIDAAVAVMAASGQLQVPTNVESEESVPDGSLEVDGEGSSSSLPLEAETVSTFPLRVVEPVLSDPYREHAGAPAAPRQGLDGTIPAPLPEALRDSAAQMGAMLGLPAGVVIWTVGERRLGGHDEFRLWLHRDGSSRIHGGAWRPNTVAATRWRPKSDWRARAMVAELLLEDLHLVADVAREWASGPTGRRRMYELAVLMREGTPAEIAVMAITGLLRETTGTAVFSRAVLCRDPWLTQGAVWVPMMGIRDRYRRLGAKVPDMVAMVDLLMDMACKVEPRMAEVEGHRTVVDEDQWVRVADDLVSAGLMEEVVYRAGERDAQDARVDIRTVP